MSGEEIELARHSFRADVLTLGFARRFATYKRPNLLLQDRDRLTRLLTNVKQPVQLILAGKAHPTDAGGQALIQEWIQFIRRAEVRGHVMFLSDYDMLLTERLAQGVDVWINTPQRPWEACGTSGMKVLVNGGVNLSVLDGWWAEAYAPNLGWALGDGQNHGGDPARDVRDARELFDLLERQVIPEFYARDASGRPLAWVARVRESMASLTPTYSANRSVRQYVEQCYLPAATAYRARAENKGALGEKIACWQRALDKEWATLKMGRVGITPCEDGYEYTVEVALGSVDPKSLLIELYADPQGAGDAFRRAMTRATDNEDCEGRSLYVARAPATRASGDYCARILPAYPGVSVPLESGRVLWAR
jgi:starch phosphorylase